MAPSSQLAAAAARRARTGSTPGVEVGRLVTGQNPASAAPLAEALVKVIAARSLA